MNATTASVVGTPRCAAKKASISSGAIFQPYFSTKARSEPIRVARARRTQLPLRLGGWKPPLHRRAVALSAALPYHEMPRLANCAARMPMTMVSWLSETNLPRTAAGETSAMYMGEMFEARPMPTPPRSRKTTNHAKRSASAVPMPVARKSSAGKDQQPLAAEAVGQSAGDHRPEQTAHQRATVGPPAERSRSAGRSAFRRTAWPRR